MRSPPAGPLAFPVFEENALLYGTAAAATLCPPVASRPLARPQAPPALRRLPALFGAATCAAGGAGDNREAGLQPGRHGGQSVCGGELAATALHEATALCRLPLGCCLHCPSSCTGPSRCIQIGPACMCKPLHPCAAVPSFCALQPPSNQDPLPSKLRAPSALRRGAGMAG